MASDDPPGGPTDPTGNREGVPRTNLGIVISVEPDICLDAGGSPVAFNLYALPSDDAGTAPTVRLNNLRAHTRTSLITVSHGDEAGTGGGVQSGTHNGICEPKTWSGTVFAENKQMIRHTDEWWMNNRNTYGKVYYVRDTKMYPRWKGEQSPQPARGDSGPPGGGGASLALLAPSPGAEAEVEAAEAELAAAEAETAAAEAGTAAVGEEAEAGAAGGEFGPIEWVVAGVVVAGSAGFVWYKISQARKKEAAARKRLEAARAAAQKPTEDIVRVTGSLKTVKDEICEMACQCKSDRGASRTLTDCVAKKLREKYYDPNGPKFPDGSPRRPESPTADGPRPEVSYDPENDYKPVESNSDPGMPSSQVPIRGAPRPDISWWSGGKLWKIFELKFGTDDETPMQREGLYEDIARANGLNPDSDLIRVNVDEDCECSATGGKAK